MKYKSLFVVLGIFLIVLCNSIVYGALNTDMFIDGDIYVRVGKDIRITDIKVVEQVAGAYEVYNCDYSKDTTSLKIALPSSDSSIVYEVTITNKSDIDYEVSNIVEESYSNGNIKYEIFDLENGTIIDRETIYTFKIKLTTTENDSENKGTLVLKYDFKEWVPSLYNMVAHKSRSLDTDIDFGVAPTKETSGVYEMVSTKDDEYPVYYYRGIIDNNNVNFAGFCWKMVRTTSTGGVKLIYNGVPGSDGSCDNTGEVSQIGTSLFNTSKSSISDVNYLYGNGSNSAVKGVIDKWYSENMIEYTKMLEDTVWCSDQEYITEYNGGYSLIYFAPYIRNLRNFVPSINCTRAEDRFSVDKSNGNGKLIYPVALLTADELTLAGSGYNGYSTSSYLFNGHKWWLLSPGFFTYSRYAGVAICDVTGALNSMDVNGAFGSDSAVAFGVRPAVSVGAKIKVLEGDGSTSNPYKLLENE